MEDRQRHSEGPRESPGPLVWEGLEAHTPHVSASTTRHLRFGFWLVGHDGLGRQEQRGDRCGVLKGRTGHLDRVVDSSSHQVLIQTGLSVKPMTVRERPNLLNHHSALKAGVDRNLTEWRG